MEIKIKRGIDLPIAGAIKDSTSVVITANSVAIYPEDYPGFTPKADVKQGDEVFVGSPLLYDKLHPEMKLCSPVSGTVSEVIRGDRRRIVCVKIISDCRNIPLKFDISNSNTAEGLIDLLCQSGVLAMLRRRPYDIVAKPDDKVRDIFVTAFDSAPLSPLTEYSERDIKAMALAVEKLSVLAHAHIYVMRRQGQIPDIAGADMVDVYGPHPSGNVGVQIANIAPINKGEVVWTMSAQTLIRIGCLLAKGNIDCSTRVALVGSCVTLPTFIVTQFGAEIFPLIEGRFASNGKTQRIISGNVLTGTKIEAEGHLRYPYTQVTVIPEGNDVDEFMGWASLSVSKMSINPSFPGHFLNKLFRPDARILGGRRAMIMSGLIDRVLPMDIMGEYLIKAINARDIDRMEQLGIYEVAPEDFALAECIDSSKVPYQQIVRDGLEYLRKELS